MKELLDGLTLSESLALIDKGSIDLSTEDNIKKIAACLAHKAEIDSINSSNKLTYVWSAKFSMTKTNTFVDGDLLCHVNMLLIPTWFYATIGDAENFSPSNNGGYWALTINTN